MPSRDDVHYFGAGPAPLPTAILEEASKVILNYNDSGVGIAEISHRSPEANAILANAKSGLRQLLDIPDSEGPDGYEILFLHGGGSGEFSATVYHMVSVWVARQLRQLKESGVKEDNIVEKLREVLEKKMRLDYLVTGSWSLKASQEAARLVGIDGVEFQSTPSGHNLIADMSSNFLSRPINVRKHAAIFGGAQKNIGTTGITIAIISNTLLPPHTEMPDPKIMRKLGLPIGPIVLDWPTIAKNNSLYNTLPIFDVWIASKVMDRLLHNSSGSPRISTQEAESNKKASMLYSALDNSSGVYSVVPDKSVRSRMNICVRVKGGDADAEKAFLKGAESRGLMGLKGHRSVGGVRISNYNAVPVEAAEKLTRYLEEFAKEQQEGGANGSV
ncbi:Phosphoserine transaminase [Vermiconidia calcicola]|uniref:Phosphoserine transaminase n=1 Tax=Vermiconidia calcicola TaxID=1690605 RepID=A0ACC3N457_9PEZI|nr:Phosphoserine transaminase [Vermiconidia calcicola]